jgi:hypothetical protein
VVTDEIVISKIHLIRHNKVMLDRDLAELYGVTTGNLNKAVKRNLDRFPEDFMFQLAADEFKNLIFRNGISRWGGTRKMPYAFTEQGVAMLSSVLKSDRAIAANIHIIRVFTRMRQMLLAHKDILIKLEELEKRILMQDGRLKKHESEMRMIFTALKELINPNGGPMRKIGFKRKEEEHSKSD